MNNEIELIEKELGISGTTISFEKIQAAYALNLCSVSVSQIIDYNDIIVLEQEYETILNNLNLENMPKDEVLLDILKRILETITFFRIQEVEKQFINKEYQQKVKDSIWSAIPNPGALIMTGLSKGAAGLAFSVATSVGTAYMNYRKNIAEYKNDKEKKEWQLRRAALEQFQSLQQQLFETSWRLAEKYEFPDALRLTEKQIKQFNSILMDVDEIRKFERLDFIKHKFIAYPAFWYYFGSTANSLVMSDSYGLDQKTKDYYKEFAKKCFEYYMIVNQYNLLREDSITASCCLEYIDLLDSNTEKEKIEGLLKIAIDSSGDSLDILQLCAVAYIKIGVTDKASYILRKLVNEQYNEITNAQLLSSIYVNDYIESNNEESLIGYNVIRSRIDEKYLFPLPVNPTSVDYDTLQNEFIKCQRQILKTKYKLVLKRFFDKYESDVNKIIPVPDGLDKGLSDDIYAENRNARENRKKQMEMILSNEIRGNDYKLSIRDIVYSYEILKILNRMFESICLLECVSDQQNRLELQQIIEKGIKDNRSKLEKIDEGISEFDLGLYEEIQQLSLKKLTGNFIKVLLDDIVESIEAKKDMCDFTIAECDLNDFCDKENIERPEILYQYRDDAPVEETIDIFFTPDMISDNTVGRYERIEKDKKMTAAIKKYTEPIVNSDSVKLYMKDDSGINDYFHKNKSLKKYKDIQSKTLAVLDDSSKGDMDLLFTTEGIMPIIKKRCKKVVQYSSIKQNVDDKKSLDIGVKYINDNLNMDKLFSLIKELSKNQAKIVESEL